MRKKLAFIAGPWHSEDKTTTIRLFALKEEQLNATGLRVTNPIEALLSLGMLEYSYKERMRLCLGWLAESDELHLLPNWQDSSASRLLRDVALRLDIPINYPTN